MSDPNLTQAKCAQFCVRPPPISFRSARQLTPPAVMFISYRLALHSTTMAGRRLELATLGTATAARVPTWSDRLLSTATCVSNLLYTRPMSVLCVADFVLYDSGNARCSSGSGPGGKICGGDNVC